MSRYNTPFEIHVHGEVPLRADVSFEQLQEALKPLWKYAGSRSLAAGAASVYEEEPGIRFDAPKHLLQMCWTVPGDDDFRQALDEMGRCGGRRGQPDVEKGVRKFQCGLDGKAVKT